MLLVTPALAGADIPPAEGESNITIEQTVSPVQGGCLPSFLALSNFVGQTDTTFVLQVNVAAPLCEPITATAVIYAMPGNDVAWPQELVETKDFVISQAGEIVITFTKTCAPVQFDVINGATPQTINSALDHGPLLFPFDTNTALQYFGCTPNSTTTTSTSTTTTSSTTTTTSSTVPVSVQGSTTIAPAISGVTTTTAPGVAVQGTSTTNRNANASALALTGSSSGWFVGLGLALVTVGGLLFLGTRRRLAHVDASDADPTMD